MAAIVTYVVISYFSAYTAKVWGVKKKWLPIVSAVTGGCCGVLGWWLGGLSSDFMDSLALGLFSGFSAVGTNEIAKYVFLRKE